MDVAIKTPPRFVIILAVTTSVFWTCTDDGGVDLTEKPAETSPSQSRHTELFFKSQLK